jgi:hypothetical protein
LQESVDNVDCPPPYTRPSFQTFCSVCGWHCFHATNTDNAEEQLATMHKNLVLMQDHPKSNFHPRSQPIQALDITIPYKLFPIYKSGTGITPYPSTWSTRYNVLKQDFTKSIKKAMSMAHMSGYDSFPGHSLRYFSASRSVLGSVKDVSEYPVKISQASSTKPTVLISGVRRLCLESYAQAQIALRGRIRRGYMSRRRKSMGLRWKKCRGRVV